MSQENPEHTCAELTNLTPDADPADIEQCQMALRNVQAFLHGELPESEAEHIRHHLMACERCMDDFDVEVVISDMLRRCYPPTQAPELLRARISALRVTVTR